jgi:amino-acid N-acetyltransferase
MQLRDARDAERAAIAALLERARLPVADLGTSDVEFVVAVDRDDVVGAVGMERHGSSGLLRSLVVDESRRRSGLGAALVAAIEARAGERRLDRLVLLTTTAREFFARRGYEPIARDAAPEPVRRSAEFRSLCPASSTCMTKTLGAP